MWRHRFCCCSEGASSLNSLIETPHQTRIVELMILNVEVRFFCFLLSVNLAQILMQHCLFSQEIFGSDPDSPTTHQDGEGNQSLIRFVLTKVKFKMIIFCFRGQYCGRCVESACRFGLGSRSWDYRRFVGRTRERPTIRPSHAQFRHWPGSCELLTSRAHSNIQVIWC